jgi:SAM-dependent methyltransferase
MPLTETEDKSSDVFQFLGGQLEYLTAAVGFNRWMFSQYGGFIRWGNIWEIGSGNGNLSEFLLPAKFALLSEYDDEYRAALERRYAQHKNVRVEPIDLQKFDVEHFRAYNFDTIISTNVIEHIKDDLAALRNITATMGPETALITLVPAHPMLYGTVDECVGHYRRYTRRGLRQTLENAGQKVTSLRYFNRASAIAWFLKFRVFKRKQISESDVGMVERFLPLLKLERFFPLPFGQSLIAVSNKRL